MKHLCSLALAAALFPHAAMPTELAMPSAAEVEARKQANRQDGRLQMPTEQALRRAAPSVPNVDALPQVGATPAPDLAELASRYERLQRGSNATAQLDSIGPSDGSRDTAPLSGLLVFVSLGMPAPTLEALVSDAERAGALLVLRGVKDHSLKATKLHIQQLIGRRRVAWRIDPTLYRSLGIQAVPTYVLIDPAQPMVQPCGAALCGQAAHSRLGGDVTMQRALQAMVEADPAFAPVAQSYLHRLGVASWSTTR